MKIRNCYFVLVLITILLAIGDLKGQVRDSTIDTDSMYYQIYSDTSDWVDFIDDSTSTAQMSVLPHPCNDKNWKRRNQAFNLCNQNPYVLIFQDEFKTFDENMWFQKTQYGFDWDWWNSDNYSGLCNEANLPGHSASENSMQGQQLYMRENVKADNGRLKIETKPVAWAVPWCGNGNSRFIWSQQYCTDNYRNANFFYTSGRAQTSWAFSRGENLSGDGLIVEARIKVPDKNGLWPAFWMNTIGGESDEFDIFEFMDNEWNKLKMTIHHRTPDASVQCRETKNLFTNNSNIERRAFFDTFHTFTFFYTDYSLAVFLDGNLKWQKHHGGRRSALSHFDCDISNNEWWGERVHYCDRPMRIIFNTHVYCANNGNHPDPNNPVYANMQIDYVNVWRKLKCLDYKKIEYQSDLNLQQTEYNVIAAKKVVVEMNRTSGSGGYDISNGNYLKIIANDYVELNDIEVDPSTGRLDVEVTLADLCKDAFDFKALNVNRRSTGLVGGRKLYEGDEGSDLTKSEDLEEIILYQNNKVLYIKKPASIEISYVKLFDAQGRLIAAELQQNNNDIPTLSLEKLSEGVYFLLILDKAGQSITRKILIENKHF